MGESTLSGTRAAGELGPESDPQDGTLGGDPPRAFAYRLRQRLPLTKCQYALQMRTCQADDAARARIGSGVQVDAG